MEGGVVEDFKDEFDKENLLPCNKLVSSVSSPTSSVGTLLYSRAALPLNIWFAQLVILTNNWQVDEQINVYPKYSRVANNTTAVTNIDATIVVIPLSLPEWLSELLLDFLDPPLPPLPEPVFVPWLVLL